MIDVNGFSLLDNNTRTGSIQQSMVIYNYKNGNRIEQFKSQVFPIDTISLEAHIMNRELILYVDRNNRSNFYFNLIDPYVEPV